MLRGISAAGSAQHWQCWGQRFESAMLHHQGTLVDQGFLFFFQALVPLLVPSLNLSYRLSIVQTNRSICAFRIGRSVSLVYLRLAFSYHRYSVQKRFIAIMKDQPEPAIPFVSSVFQRILIEPPFIGPRCFLITGWIIAHDQLRAVRNAAKSTIWVTGWKLNTIDRLFNECPDGRPPPSMGRIRRTTQNDADLDKRSASFLLLKST